MATTDTQVPMTGRAAANSSNGGSSGAYDAIVVGGGHNGLTTAAYLAKAGQKVLGLARRPVLGGACVTEELWPGRRVSRASYVVSMLQPRIVKDLRLEDFGYRAVPLEPAYAALTPEGPVVSYDDPAATADSIRPLSAHDADNFVAFEERLFRVAAVLTPMLTRAPDRK